MANTPESSPPMTADLIMHLAALAGVELTIERAETLAPQAEQQRALMRTLERLDPGSTEPMGVCRLDRLGDAE